MMRIIGVITARGGSKGVPRKNIAKLGGRSLLSYTALAALSAQLLSRVIVSTDDDEIAVEAERCGIEVPFRRPAELARDETPTLPVLQHAVQFLEQTGETIDAICILQPTHPFRSSEDIDGCLELFQTSGADSAMTVTEVPHEFNPHWVYFRSSDGSLRLATGESTPIPRRQELPPAFHREGSVYVTRRDVLMRQNSIYGSRVVGYPVSAENRVNIDTLDDFRRAEEMIACRQQLKAN